jgi:hypothetical protein
MSNLKNNPVCPHCGYEFDDDETWHSQYSEESMILTSEDEESEPVCLNEDCGKQFKVRCVAVIMFDSEEDEDLA